MTLFWSDLWSKLLKSYLSFSLASHKKKNRCKSIVLQRFLVRPAGIEPTSSEPESDILSIELRAQDEPYCLNIASSHFNVMVSLFRKGFISVI